MPSATPQQRTALGVKPVGFCRNESFFSLFLSVSAGKPPLPSPAPSSLPRISCGGDLALPGTAGPHPAGGEQPCSCPSLYPWLAWGGSDPRTSCSGQAEADAQPGRAMQCIAPHPFSATLNSGFLHHGDSRTLPSTRLGTFLGDADLLLRGQLVGNWLGAS